MEYFTWIDKHFSEIKKSLLYGKFFDTLSVENGTDVLYLLNPNLGIDLIFTLNFYVKAIHFYSGATKETKRFTDDLPYGLKFDLSREQTRHILGSPNMVGGGDYSMIYGTTPFWDKYMYSNHNLHLQFSEDLKEIHLITLSSLK